MKTAIVFAMLDVMLIWGIHGAEKCPKENCIVPSHCEQQIKNPADCKKPNMCCSVVKAAYRTHCRHFGGVCTGFCPDTLSRDTGVNGAKIKGCDKSTVCCGTPNYSCQLSPTLFVIFVFFIFSSCLNEPDDARTCFRCFFYHNVQLNK